VKARSEVSAAEEKVPKEDHLVVGTGLRFLVRWLEKKVGRGEAVKIIGKGGEKGGIKLVGKKGKAWRELATVLIVVWMTEVGIGRGKREGDLVFYSPRNQEQTSHAVMLKKRIWSRESK